MADELSKEIINKVDDKTFEVSQPQPTVVYRYTVDEIKARIANNQAMIDNLQAQADDSKKAYQKLIDEDLALLASAEKQGVKI